MEPFRQAKKTCEICEMPIEQEVLIARPQQPVCRACGNEIEAVQANRRVLYQKQLLRH